MSIKSISVVGILAVIALCVVVVPQAHTVLAENGQSAEVVRLGDVTDAKAGKSITFKAYVKNTGSSTFDSNCEVWFWVKGKGIEKWVGPVSCRGLTSRSSSWYEIDLQLPSNAEGAYKYWAKVYTKSGGKYVKISEWSSPKSFDIQSVTVLAENGQSAEVVRLGEVTDAKAGKSITFKAYVKNTGSSTFDSNCEVWFWVKGKGIEKWVGPVSCRGLTSRSSSWYEIDLQLPSNAEGAYKYWAKVYTKSGGKYVKISEWSSSKSFDIQSVIDPKMIEMLQIIRSECDEANPQIHCRVIDGELYCGMEGETMHSCGPVNLPDFKETTFDLYGPLSDPYTKCVYDNYRTVLNPYAYCESFDKAKTTEEQIFWMGMYNYHVIGQLNQIR